MKKAIFGLVFLLAVCLAAPAYADLGHVRKINSIGQRAMGGLDLTLDPQIPAVSALEPQGWGMSFFNFEAGGNVAEYLLSSDWLDEADVFLDDADAMIDGLNEKRPDLARVNKMMDDYNALARRGHYGFALRSRAELMKLRFGLDGVGHFSLGAYGEGDAAILVNAPDPEETDFKVGLREGKLDGWADIGAPRNVVSGRGRGDVGGYFGYGRAFNLSQKVNLGAGAKLRVFRRWVVPSAVMILPKEVRRKKDIKSFPDGAESGTGFDVDLSTMLDMRDPLIATKLAFGLENIGGVWYQSGAAAETPRFSVGTSFAPFHVLGNDNFVVGMEMEDFASDQAKLELGILYAMLGNDLINISPRAGFIFNEKTLFGEDSHIVTTGFSFRFLSLNLVGLYEYDITHGVYGVGAGLEWILF